jgi:hypothetical protein
MKGYTTEPLKLQCILHYTPSITTIYLYCITLAEAGATCVSELRSRLFCLYMSYLCSFLHNLNNFGKMLVATFGCAMSGNYISYCLILIVLLTYL